MTPLAPLRAFALLLAASAPAQTHIPMPKLGGPHHARIAVVLFVASDCALSNRYAPEIQRLPHIFGPRVPFWIVYPNATETTSTIREHEAAFHLAAADHVLTGLALVHLTGALVTPSAAVLVRKGLTWRPVYVGRIDDHYPALGRERTLTTRHDLEDALTATLAGQPVPAPGGPAIGCAIVEHP